MTTNAWWVMSMGDDPHKSFKASVGTLMHYLAPDDPEKKPDVQCDECGETFSARRIRTVQGYNTSVTSNHCIGVQEDHKFCGPCHRKVFAESDWRKYPALFTERRDYRPEMSEWMTAAELGAMLEIESDAATAARKVAAVFRTDCELMGLKLQRQKAYESSTNYLYRVEPPKNS